MRIKKYKQLFAGILIGAIISTGGSVFANTTNVTAKVADWVKFKFDGVEKYLAQGYTVLEYKGHMYVPARYVAEELGANVDWNKQTQTVSINKQNSETTNPVDEEKTPVVTVPSTPVEQKPCNCDIKSDYEKLPLSKINEGIIVDVYDVVLKNDRTTFYVKVKNITDLPMQLDQESVTFTTDGETYKHTQLDETILFRKDTAWYNDIQEDERKEGFIMIPGLPEEVKEGTLNLTVVQNDRTQKEIPFQFKVKWD